MSVEPTRNFQPDDHPTADPLPETATRSVGEPTHGPGGTPTVVASSAPPGYELLAEIGQGGMGLVYRARDTSLNRDVAVKVLQQKYAPTSAVARRFLEEAHVTGQLQHPGIPPIHAVGTLSDGRPFLAMKLIKGRTLDDILQDGSVTRGSLIAVFEQVCQAVGYAHNHGVIHRDLKPHNVMVGAFGEVQVMDWGLAKFRTDTRTETLEATTASTFHDPRADADESLKTQPGAVLGTPAYMAPEQAIGAVELIDERSDVFGLGAVLCVILTGKPPFVGNTAESTRQLAAQGKLSDAFARLDGCAAEPELVALCKRCMSPERDTRPRNAGELAVAIHDFRAEAEERARQAELDRVRAEGERAKAEVQTAEQRKRRKVQLALAAAVGLLLLGGGAFAWWQDKQRGERESDALRQQIEDERRQETERNRLARNTEAIESLVGQTEEALRNDDVTRAAIQLDEAEKRATEGGADHLKDRLSRCRHDLAMLRELDRIESLFLTVVRTKFLGRGEVAKEWPGAFARYGIVPGTTPLADAVRRVNESLVRDRLLTTLDRWFIWSRSAEILAILRAADPDGFRDAVRAAVATEDVDRTAELLDQRAAVEQPTRFVVVLGNLPGVPVERRARLLLTALQRRPGDFGLLSSMRSLYMGDKSMAREKEVWARAALAARPGNALAHQLLGIALNDQGKHDEAIAAYREAARVDPDNASPHISLGLQLALKRDLDGAVAEFREAIRLNPKDASAHSSLGLALVGKQDFAGAVAAYKEAIRLEPENAEFHHGLGVALKASGDVDGAITAYREAIRIEPDYAGAHRELGFALANKKELDGAVAAYREAIRHDRNHSLTHFYLGVALEGKKDLDGAIAAFQEAIRIEPKLPFAHHNLGSVLRDKGDLDGAVAAYREATRIDPKFAASHLQLGTVLTQRARLNGADQDEAIKAIREALRHDEKIPRGNFMLGNALMIKGDWDGAAKAYRKAIQIDPTDAPVHFMLGGALLQKGDPDGAVAAFRETLRLDQTHVAARYNLAGVLRDRKDFDGAVAVYKDAIRFDPKDIIARRNLAGTLREKRDLDGAVEAYRELIRHAPKDATAHRDLGLVLEGKKDFDGAVVAYKEVIRLNPKDAEAHTQLGAILCDVKKDYDGATAAFREAIRIDPRYAVAHNNLAVACFQQKRYREAVSAAREAIKLAPNFADAHSIHGAALLKLGDRRGAEAAWQEAAKLDPKRLGSLLKQLPPLPVAPEPREVTRP